jgi:hypothetical protein
MRLMPVATSIVMDVVSFAWSRAVALKPFLNCRSDVIGLAIAGSPKNDGHLSPWQEASGLRSSRAHTHTRTAVRTGIDGPML